MCITRFQLFFRILYTRTELLNDFLLNINFFYELTARITLGMGYRKLFFDMHEEILEKNYITRILKEYF